MVARETEPAVRGRDSDSWLHAESVCMHLNDMLLRTAQR